MQFCIYNVVTFHCNLMLLKYRIQKANGLLNQISLIFLSSLKIGCQTIYTHTCILTYIFYLWSCLVMLGGNNSLKMEFIT